MKRRQFIVQLVTGVAAWPIRARAQQGTIPVIGFLNTRSPDDTRHLVAAFRQGLNERGIVEGHNVILEYRWALGQYDRLSAMATEFVHRPVTLLASSGGEPAALAAKAATSTIPIVFVIGGDPVKAGLATTLSSPGGNSTGITILTTTLEPKRLGLLRELVPGAASIGIILNPSFPPHMSQLRDIQEAANAIALQVIVLRADTDREIEVAFETAAQRRLPALIVTADPFFDTRRDKLVALAARHAVPTMYHFREFVAAGGLMSYGANVADAYRQAGLYAARILKGERPADLPVQQSTKVELVINLQTAKTLGITMPPTLLAFADEVID